MLRRLAVQLIPALVLACSAAADGRVAEYLGTYVWQMDEPWFGGFSGLEMTADGMGMTALTDRSTCLSAEMVRDSQSRITGVQVGRVSHLKSSTGTPMTGRVADSEGLAIAPDGTIYVSFEGVHRVVRFDTPDSLSAVLRRPREFRALAFNGSFEALAIDGAGRLYTLPEDGADAAGNIPVFRLDKDGWSIPFTLPLRGDFLPVGADFGPDHRFYLLERAYGLSGFRSRVRQWNLTETGAENERTLLETRPRTHDNLEGLSVWRDGAGRLRLTMIADDNFMAFQTTEIVEYTVAE
jgi:hypothetical protein